MADQPPHRKLDYPLFIIAEASGQEPQIGRRGDTVYVTLFQHLELAELYLEQMAERGVVGAEILPVLGAESFLGFLRTLKHQHGVTHLVIDSLADSRKAMATTIDQAIEAANGEHENDDPEPWN